MYNNNVDATLIVVNEIRLNARDKYIPSFNIKNQIEEILQRVNDTIVETTKEFLSYSDIILGDVQIILDEYNSHDENDYYLVLNDYDSIIFENGEMVSDMDEITVYNVESILGYIPEEFIYGDFSIEIAILEIGIIKKNEPIIILPPGSIPPPKKSKRK